MTDPALQLRPAVTSDWPELWPLLGAMGGVRDDEATSRSRFMRLMGSDNWFVVMAFQGDRAVGYAAAQDYGDHLRAGCAGRVARLHDMFVVIEDRQRGVGGQLMERVVVWASMRVRYLQWQAHEQRSAPFYERLGYRGSPCPQPDYPEFEIAFPTPATGQRQH